MRSGAAPISSLRFRACLDVFSDSLWRCRSRVGCIVVVADWSGWPTALEGLGANPGLRPDRATWYPLGANPLLDRPGLHLFCASSMIHTGSSCLPSILRAMRCLMSCHRCASALSSHGCWPFLYSGAVRAPASRSLAFGRDPRAHAGGGLAYLGRHLQLIRAEIGVECQHRRFQTRAAAVTGLWRIRSRLQCSE
jgi:hypothetical protein